MSKRLQVLLQDKELTEIQQAARRQQMTTAEWVRQALRAARRTEPRIATRKKLEVLRVAARNAFPAPGIEQMLKEIERGYLGDRSP
ncbi:MAG TPA: antitoxin [Casimicrobiaceae bacterium]|nr:antitoxin [Casimicrobiaceae bacterium]